MDENSVQGLGFFNRLKNRLSQVDHRTAFDAFLILLIVVGIIVTVFLAGQRQIFRSGASQNGSAEVVGENGQPIQTKDESGNPVVETQQIRIKIQFPTDWNQGALPSIVNSTYAQTKPLCGSLYQGKPTTCADAGGNMIANLGKTCGHYLSDYDATNCENADPNYKYCWVEKQCSATAPTSTPIPTQPPTQQFCPGKCASPINQTSALAEDGSICTSWLRNRVYDYDTKCRSKNTGYDWCYTSCAQPTPSPTTPPSVQQPTATPAQAQRCGTNWEGKRTLCTAEDNRPNCTYLEAWSHPRSEVCSTSTPFCWACPESAFGTPAQPTSTPTPTQPPQGTAQPPTPTPEPEQTLFIQVSQKQDKLGKDKCTRTSNPADDCLEFPITDPYFTQRGNLVDVWLPPEPGTYTIYIGFVSNKGNYKSGPPVKVIYQPKETPPTAQPTIPPTPTINPADYCDKNYYLPCIEKSVDPDADEPTCKRLAEQCVIQFKGSTTPQPTSAKPSCLSADGVCVNKDFKNQQEDTCLGKNLSTSYDCPSNYPFCNIGGSNCVPQTPPSPTSSPQEPPKISSTGTDLSKATNIICVDGKAYEMVDNTESTPLGYSCTCSQDSKVTLSFPEEADTITTNSSCIPLATAEVSPTAPPTRVGERILTGEPFSETEKAALPRAWDNFTSFVGGLAGGIKNTFLPDEQTKLQRETEKLTSELRRAEQGPIEEQYQRKKYRALVDLDTVLRTSSTEIKAGITRSLLLSDFASDEEITTKFTRINEEDPKKLLEFEGNLQDQAFRLIKTERNSLAFIFYETPEFRNERAQKVVQTTTEVAKDVATLGFYSVFHRFKELREDVLPTVQETCRAGGIDTASRGFSYLVGEYQGGQSQFCDPNLPDLALCSPGLTDSEKEEAQTVSNQIQSSQNCKAAYLDYVDLVVDAKANAITNVALIVDPIVIGGTFFKVGAAGRAAATRLAQRGARIRILPKVAETAGVVERATGKTAAELAQEEIEKAAQNLGRERIAQVSQPLGQTAAELLQQEIELAAQNLPISFAIASEVAPAAGERAAQTTDQLLARGVPDEQAIRQSVVKTTRETLAPLIDVQTQHAAEKALQEAEQRIITGESRQAAEAAQTAVGNQARELVERIAGVAITVPTNPAQRIANVIVNTFDSTIDRVFRDNAEEVARASERRIREMAQAAVAKASQQAKRLAEEGTPLDEITRQVLQGSEFQGTLKEIAEERAKAEAEKALSQSPERTAELARGAARQSVDDMGTRLVAEEGQVAVQAEGGVFTGKSNPVRTGEVTTPNGTVQIQVEENGLIQVGKPVSAVSKEEAEKGLRFLLNAGEREPTLLPHEDLDVPKALNTAGITPRKVRKGEFGTYYYLTPDLPINTNSIFSRKTYLRFKDEEAFAEFLKTLQRVAPELEGRGIVLNFKFQDEIILYLVGNPLNTPKELFDQAVNSIRRAIDDFNRGGLRVESRGLYAEDPLGLVVHKDGSISSFTPSTRNGPSNDSLISREIIPRLLQVAEKYERPQKLAEITPQGWSRSLSSEHILKVFESNPVAAQEILAEYRKLTGVTFRDFADATKARAIPIAVETADEASLQKALAVAAQLKRNGYETAVIDAASISEKGYLLGSSLREGGFAMASEDTVRRLTAEGPERVVVQAQRAVGSTVDQVGQFLQGERAKIAIPGGVANSQHGAFGLLGRAHQDASKIVPEFRDRKDSIFLGVFDGHGGEPMDPRSPGKWAADFAADNLPRTLAYLLEQGWEPSTALQTAYTQTHHQMLRAGLQDGGSSTVTAFIQGNELYVANAGDSRAVLSRNGNAIRLSYDHKAIDPNEIARVQSLGARVKNSYLLDERGGSLAVTRSLGDPTFQPYAIPDPYITRTTLDNLDEFVVLASDGIFDVMSDQQVVDFVRGALSRGRSLNDISESLTTFAQALGTDDDLTVVIGSLK